MSDEQPEVPAPQEDTLPSNSRPARKRKIVPLPATVATSPAPPVPPPAFAAPEPAQAQPVLRPLRGAAQITVAPSNGITREWLPADVAQAMPEGLEGEQMFRWVLAYQRGQADAVSVRQELADLDLRLEEMCAKLEGVFLLLQKLGNGIGELMLRQVSAPAPLAPNVVPQRPTPQAHAPDAEFAGLSDDPEELAAELRAVAEVGRPGSPPRMTNADAEQVWAFAQSIIPVPKCPYPTDHQLQVARQEVDRLLKQWSMPGSTRIGRCQHLVQDRLQLLLLPGTEEAESAEMAKLQGQR